MLGNNQLHLCIAEMMVAVQEYLDKRMTTYAPKVTDVTMYKGETFVINLSEKVETKLSECYRVK